MARESVVAAAAIEAVGEARALNGVCRSTAEDHLVVVQGNALAVDGQGMRAAARQESAHVNEVTVALDFAGVPIFGVGLGALIRTVVLIEHAPVEANLPGQHGRPIGQVRFTHGATARLGVVKVERAVCVVLCVADVGYDEGIEFAQGITSL